MTRTETRVAKAVNSMAEELATEKVVIEKEKGIMKKLFGL
jgi:hypothetical protein